MRPNVQALQPFAEVKRSQRTKNTRYICAACGVEFLDYPGLPVEWPEPGNGLPPFCDNPDCHAYLVNMSLMREWMAKHDATAYKDPEGKVYR